MERFTAEGAESAEGGERDERFTAEGAEGAERGERDEGFAAEGAEKGEMAERGKGGVDGLTGEIIAGAIEVHRELGPGLLESTYEACLVFELGQRGLLVERQKALPVSYKGVRVDCGYRIDLLVEGQVIVELKAVHSLEPIHEAQLLSYLKLSGCHVGLLINFNVKLLKSGLRRLVNNLPQ